MANTAIILTNEEGALVPSLPSVPVNSGDTITFSTSDGSAAFLFFSPGAISVLSPTPVNPVQVSAATTFSFLSSSPGAYSVYFETTAAATVPDFPVVPSASILLEIDLSNVKYGVINTDTKG